MSTPIYILGGYQTDFAVNWTREGRGGIQEMLTEVVQGALGSSQVPAGDVDVAHVGNFVGEIMAGQGQLGGIVAQADPAFAQLPTSRHEAACCSGSIATLSATAEIEAGRYDVALVAGVELLRNVPGEDAARHMGCAALVPVETTDERYPWPHLFSRIANEYDARYSVDHSHLARIGEINVSNARRNPRAQTRDWDIPSGSFTDDDFANPIVDGMLRRWDCGRITDGGAAVILAGPRYAAEYARAHGVPLDRLPRIDGWGHRSAPIQLEEKLRLGAGGPYVFPHLRTAVTDAFRRAGLSGPEQLDLIETHDCFTISEYVAIDHFGITPPGKSGQAVEEGVIDAEGALPINPSGGLIGLGHPVGATGVRMLLDCARQVSGQAGDYQVEGARTAATFNIGGSFTTVVSFVVTTGDRAAAAA